MRKRNKFSIYIGLAACLLSQGLWAACNSSIKMTKPDNIYIDHLDGTVTDSETGLMWQKCSLGQVWNAGADANSGSDDSCDSADPLPTYTWQVALAKANEDNSFAYSNWRLPNINEMRTLVEYACTNPSINSTIFPNTIARTYWLSTIYADNNEKVWQMTFLNGSAYMSDKSEEYNVRLVRNN